MSAAIPLLFPLAGALALIVIACTIRAAGPAIRALARQLEL